MRIPLLVFASFVLPGFVANRTMAQCTVAIPSNAVVVDTDTSLAVIGQSVWVCASGSVNASSIDPVLFVESGGYLNMSGFNKKVYLKAGATIECSGIGDTIWYENGATINCSGDHVDILCSQLTFDLSNAPEHGCANATTGLRDLSRSRFSAVLDRSTSSLNLSFPAEGPWQVQLIDAAGRSLQHFVIRGARSRVALPGPTTGLFLILAQGPQGTFTERFAAP